MKQKTRINCYRCRHYFVTWDKQRPHGCRAMNFKSKALPSVEVFKSSGSPCLLYSEKEKPEKV